MSPRRSPNAPMPSQPEMSPSRFLAGAIAYHGDDCLEWPFSKSGGGYGKIGRNGKILDVHRLVCREVHGAPPEPKFETAHSCGNRACCNPQHLRWDSRKGNFSDKLKHGTLIYGERHVNSKLSTTQIAEIRELGGKLFQREIAAIFNISQTQVGRILCGKRRANG